MAVTICFQKLHSVRHPANDRAQPDIANGNTVAGIAALPSHQLLYVGSELFEADGQTTRRWNHS